MKSLRALRPLLGLSAPSPRPSRNRRLCGSCRERRRRRGHSRGLPSPLWQTSRSTRRTCRRPLQTGGTGKPLFTDISRHFQSLIRKSPAQRGPRAPNRARDLQDVPVWIRRMSLDRLFGRNVVCAAVDWRGDARRGPKIMRGSSVRCNIGVGGAPSSVESLRETCTFGARTEDRISPGPGTTPIRRESNPTKS